MSENARELQGSTECSRTDCFVNHRSGFDPQGRLSGENNEGEGKQAPAGPDPTLPTLSLEDRLYVVLARRGHQGIGQFILNAAQNRDCGCMALAWNDPAFVDACERYADSLCGEPPC